ncbi:MAG: hypothetical protein BAJALOKI1v1_10011 [Promethearchaeota archaeon]|nr:MAG: hypothetical protein BAJALOKI1v1_10011 [Candidatus Lokiarchaeota archaeon]
MEGNIQNSQAERSERKNKIKKIVITILLISSAIIAPFLIYYLLQLTLNTSSPMVVVISGSMEPTYSRGDLLFLSGENPNDIGLGDVIVFDARGVWLNPPQEPVVHRVINKTFYKGLWWFQTKGDANLFPDQWGYEPSADATPLTDPRWLPQTNIIGTVVGHIPYIGWIKLFLTENFIYPLLIIILCVLIISLVYDYIKKEEEATITERKDPEENFFPTNES